LDRILFLSANPSDSEPLKVLQECNEIKEKIRASRFRDRFELVQMHAISVKELQRVLLENQPQYLHFSGHGTQESALIFQNEGGQSEEVAPDALTGLFKILGKNIRCIFLNACYSEKQAKALAKHVDYVIGMIRSISDDAAKNFAASFYQALGYGQSIKNAFFLARNQLELSKMTEEQTPKLLSNRQFTADTAEEDPDMAKDSFWGDFLDSIKQKKCLPFLGAEIFAPWFPYDLFDEWTEGYPFDDYSQISRVAQFIAIEKGDIKHPKKRLCSRLKEIKPPDFTQHGFNDTPYAILANLELPIYMTTNYDHFLEEALKSRGKRPVTEVCSWNSDLKKFLEYSGQHSLLGKGSKYKPSVENPLVYHLYGDMNVPQSMVLTERDYIDFIINLSIEDEKSTLPPVIRTSLASSSLLFVGYSLEEINFRILFQGVGCRKVGDLGETSIAVQLRPRLTKEKQEKALKYLREYFNDKNVHVCWGDPYEFCDVLWQKIFVPGRS
jgi:hypothetical protein